MNRATEQETNDEFDPRGQSSCVYRAVAFFCCFLFLFWSARFQGASESPITFVRDAPTASASVDEQNGTLSEISALEAEQNKVEKPNATAPKLVLIVDLNAATKAELTNLPGIGEALAERVVEYRESVGAFSDVEELLEVKGIGVKKLAAIRPFCVVGNVEEEREEAEF